MSTTTNDKTDQAAGLLLMGAAGFFGYQTTGLPIGTLFRMGPGFFPMILSALLFGLGVLIFLKSFGRMTEPFGRIAWRGMALILPAPVVFGLTVRGLGFVPALFIATLIASQASVKMRPLPSLILATVVTILSTLIFSTGLGLPFRLFGPWVRF
ncbi:tripartite tricarboxylate transporter TctB family protein [Paracoccus nototheniae]|uniref:Tripartite tricarboxylate transporter TctB family protein n=1 Tax=Paracoccus nototheniae TaxID=2489002 RepID=A0ABW4E335_9RHOB|nr:tripartite tricarboxylate transporter TctB family protein [Paracoccus nototheniae]